MNPAQELAITESVPSVEENIALRSAVGWRVPNQEAVRISLRNCLYSVCVRDGERIIGHGRVVGDGGMYFYIQEIIVHPDYQGCGLGVAIMDRIMAYLDEYTLPGATIGLLAATAKEPFYERYGFMRRPSERMGCGMCIFV